MPAKRKYYKKRGQTAMQKATKALAIVQKQKRAVEWKYHDRLVTSTNITQLGTVNTLTFVPQGDTNQTRDGDKLQARHLSIRGTLTSNGSKSTAKVRLIVFRANKENASNLLQSEILDNNDPNSHKSWSDRFRTKTLLDRTYDLNQQVSGTLVLKSFNFNIKLNDPINFTAGTTAIENGGIYMMYLSDTVVNMPTIIYQSRLLFTDT